LSAMHTLSTIRRAAPLNSNCDPGCVPPSSPDPDSEPCFNQMSPVVEDAS
jgi:hypothetical protein